MIPVYRTADEIPAGFGPSIAAIGNFDGVHLGHRELLDAVVTESRERGMRPVAVTFDPHPERFLRPASAPGLLTLMEHRTRLLAATGVEAVLVMPFDQALASMRAREFVGRVLVDRLGVRSLHEGANFRCGYQAEAGAAELRKLGEEFGFALHVHLPVFTHGMEISSSTVRALVTKGDLRRARWMLGRPFAVRSRQARGRGIGSELLVPTVNLADYEGLLPPFGVYVTRLLVAGRRFEAVTNVGNRPTFGEASFCVESHILDFEPIEIGSEAIELEFLFHLRGEQSWPSPDALKAQILRDVARAQRCFRLLNDKTVTV